MTTGLPTEMKMFKLNLHEYRHSVRTFWNILTNWIVVTEEIISNRMQLDWKPLRRNSEYLAPGTEWNSCLPTTVHHHNVCYVSQFSWDCCRPEDRINVSKCAVNRELFYIDSQGFCRGEHVPLCLFMAELGSRDALCSKDGSASFLWFSSWAYILNIRLQPPEWPWARLCLASGQDFSAFRTTAWISTRNLHWML